MKTGSIVYTFLSLFLLACLCLSGLASDAMDWYVRCCAPSCLDSYTLTNEGSLSLLCIRGSGCRPS